MYLSDLALANDGHNSSVTVAGAWAKRFLTLFLSNPNFMQNTLILLSMPFFANKFSHPKFSQPSTRPNRTSSTPTEFSLSYLEMLFRSRCMKQRTVRLSITTASWPLSRIIGASAISESQTLLLPSFFNGVLGALDKIY